MSGESGGGRLNEFDVIAIGIFEIATKAAAIDATLDGDRPRGASRSAHPQGTPPGSLNVINEQTEMPCSRLRWRSGHRTLLGPTVGTVVSEKFDDNLAARERQHGHLDITGARHLDNGSDVSLVNNAAADAGKPQTINIEGQRAVKIADGNTDMSEVHQT